MSQVKRMLAVVAGLGLLAGIGQSAEPTPVERGEKALLTRSFNPPTITIDAYKNAWKFWGEKLKEPPADYDRAFREHYGLHETPYPNGAYPMGMREVPTLFSKGISTDCMLCHGGSIMGKSYVGLGNSSMDYQSLYEDLARADGRGGATPFVFSNVRGTIEAGGMAVFLMSIREPDLKIRPKPLDLELHDDMCEDTPAWWLLKKKKTMYHDGGGNADSVRTLMQFMLSPLNMPSTIMKEEKTFVDIQAYLKSIPSPAYPFEIDAEKAKTGQKVFTANCSRCHGTYGEKWTYPNRVVPLKEIGTDPARYNGLSQKFAENYIRSWFAKEKEGWFADDYTGQKTGGYQAPPLDGVWATAPYFHNGSAPTVYHVLNSKARPKIFTRSYRTDKDSYDMTKLGWKFTELDRPANAKLPGFERRKVYDTTQPGRGNGGHTYGDELSDEERMAVIEYLKTL